MKRVVSRLLLAAFAGALGLVDPVESQAQGADAYSLPIIVRDVVAGAQAPPAGTPAHPDFEWPPTGVVTGEVLPTLVVNPQTYLGAIRPSPTATTFGAGTFETWFANTPYNASVDGSAPVFHVSTEQITMTHLGSGVYQFRDTTFDPLNGRGFGNYPGVDRNYHFTVEAHPKFIYHAAAGYQPMLRACSDDSMWIFINGTLVVDLGGVRNVACGQVDVAGLGLQDSQAYSLDVFYADRTRSTSHFEVTTNLPLYVPWIDSMPPAAGVSTVTLEADGPSGTDVQEATLGALDGTGGPATQPVPTMCLEPFGAYPVGTHQFHCTAADAWGNQTSFVSEVTVRDTHAPAVTSAGDISVEAGGAVTSVTWVDPVATDSVDVNVEVTCSPASGSAFAVGATTVSCSAVDDAGNRGSTSFFVTVVDSTPPAVTPPADLTAIAADATGMVITWPAVTAADLVDGNLIAACAPASGSLFQIGVTTVTCAAIDAHGNTSQVAFDVTVVEPPPPPPSTTDTDHDGVDDNTDPFDQSDLAPFVRVGSCTTRVANRLLPAGATFNDLIAAALAGARNHGGGISAVARLAAAWERARLITGRERGMITSCAGRDDDRHHGHRDGDTCDHERGRNGHKKGDGCDHERRGKK